jgi:hypothetical protein
VQIELCFVKAELLFMTFSHLLQLTYLSESKFLKDYSDSNQFHANKEITSSVHYAPSSAKSKNLKRKQISKSLNEI